VITTKLRPLGLEALRCFRICATYGSRPTNLWHNRGVLFTDAAFICLQTFVRLFVCSACGNRTAKFGSATNKPLICQGMRGLMLLCVRTQGSRFGGRRPIFRQSWRMRLQVLHLDRLLVADRDTIAVLRSLKSRTQCRLALPGA
jgi:hypothetical protein